MLPDILLEADRDAGDAGRMGIVINPRGAGGSGKTRLARLLMAGFGDPVPIPHPGRARPIGHRLAHPAGGRPLAVLGAYEGTCGGCDTIPETDGGLAEAFRLAAAWASEGHDVLMEGLLLSMEQHRTVALAEAHPLHILRLDTSLGDCGRALAARRHVRRQVHPGIEQSAALMDAAVEEACRRLSESHARVERLGREEAFLRACTLLGLPCHRLLAIPA